MSKDLIGARSAEVHVRASIAFMSIVAVIAVEDVGPGVPMKAIDASASAQRVISFVAE